MSRTTPTILCNLCMVEDLENGKVVLQYRSPEKTHWAGYAFPGGHIEEGESLVESVIREIKEETGLTIFNPRLVDCKKLAVRGWHPLHRLLLQSDRIYRPAKIVWWRRSFLGWEGSIRKVGLVLRHATSAGSDGRPGLVWVLLSQTDRRWLGKITLLRSWVDQLFSYSCKKWKKVVWWKGLGIPDLGGFIIYEGFSLWCHCGIWKLRDWNHERWPCGGDHKVVESSLNYYGNAHGGYLFTLCDQISGLVVISQGVDGVTLQSSINYLKAGRLGDILTIHGECVHSGRTTRVVDVDITNQEGANVCKATFTMFVTGERDESAKVRI